MESTWEGDSITVNFGAIFVWPQSSSVIPSGNSGSPCPSVI